MHDDIMAAKETKTVLERTYTIPLRKEFLKVASWRRTEKAVFAVQKFLKRHMKSDHVKLGKALNEFIWKQGIKNPPHKVKVNAQKDEKGVVRAELFDAPEPQEKTQKKKTPSPQKTKEGEAEEITKKTA